MSIEELLWRHDSTPFPPGIKWVKEKWVNMTAEVERKEQCHKHNRDGRGVPSWGHV